MVSLEASHILLLTTSGPCAALLSPLDDACLSGVPLCMAPRKEWRHTEQDGTAVGLGWLKCRVPHGDSLSRNVRVFILECS